MIEQQILNHLRERSNLRDIVTVHGDVLGAELGLRKEALAEGLARLERAGLLKVYGQLPFLVAKLGSWRSKRPKPEETRLSAYSFNKLSHNRVNESYSPSGDDGLLHEILDTLGETDPTTFVGAIKNFSPRTIRKALDRVRRTKSLRKNRTALFRYLLTKLT
ncbi:MAG: hypothetical protein ABIU54_10635 [Candidatus Eisenbacteria bacterium]